MVKEVNDLTDFVLFNRKNLLSFSITTQTGKIINYYNIACCGLLVLHFINIIKNIKEQARDRLIISQIVYSIFSNLGNRATSNDVFFRIIR